MSRQDKENDIVLYGKADEVGCDVTTVFITNQDLRLASSFFPSCWLKASLEPLEPM
jgi:hypothetical protein